MAHVSRLLQCFLINSKRYIFSPKWNGHSPPLHMPRPTSQNWSTSSGSIVLVCPHFRVGAQDSQAGLAFQWLHQNQRQSCTCSHGHLFIQTMESWLFFFPNWHRLCLGQEPNINYKDWPQPREHEKKLDNTVGKLFSHVNWHSKYVLVLCTFSMPMEPSGMENNVLALVSRGTWTDWNLSIRQSNFN